MLKIIIFFTLSFTLSSLQAQNGWTQERKSSYTQLSISSFSSNKYYSVDGKLFDQGSTFHSNGLILYSEYGLTSRLTSVINFPAIVINNFNTSKKVIGAGNARVGLKYGIFKHIPFSIQIDAEIPTSDGTNFSQSKEPNEIGIIERVNLPTSDGEFNFLTTLAFSQSFNRGKSFASIYSTYNKRTQSFSDQVQIGGEVGHLFFNKLHAIIKLKIQEQMNPTSNPNASFLYGEGTTFTSTGITVMYKIKDHWKIVGGTTTYNQLLTPLRNIYKGWTFDLGLAYDL